MITALHHFSILTATEETVSFYEKLGFESYYRKDRTNDTIILMKGHGVEIEMFIDPRHPNRLAGIDEPLGPRHVAFEVDDIEKTAAELKAADLSVGDIGTDWTGIRYCYITDPDGNQVELHE